MSTGLARAALRFVLISDRTGGARPGVFEQGLAVTDLLAPDFAIQLGDVIEGYSEDRVEIERQWTEVDALYAGMRTPVVQVPGNHDISNPVQTEIWRARRGPTYHHFRHDDVLFCIVDTQDPAVDLADQPLAAGHDHVGFLAAWNGTQPARLSETQLAYWEAVLAEHADVRWTFVCLHMPLWQGDHPAWARLRRALGLRQYTAFAGHVHSYRHDLIAGRSHVRLGPTGGMWVLDDAGANADHVTQVALTERGPVVANVLLDGIRGLDGTQPRPACTVPLPILATSTD